MIAYGSEAHPSTRLRIVQYLPVLEGRGFRFEQLFVPQGRDHELIEGLVDGLGRADIVFVQRVLDTRSASTRFVGAASPSSST